MNTISHSLFTNLETYALELCPLSGTSILVYSLPPSPHPITSIIKTTDAPIQFTYCLSGSATICATDKTKNSVQTELNSGTGAVFFLPFFEGHSTILPNSPVQLVDLQIAPTILKHLVEVGDFTLNSTLNRMVEYSDPSSSLFVPHLPLSINVTLQQILDCPLKNGINNLFLKYKMMELIYLQLALLTTNSIKNNTESSHNICCAYQARSLLLKDITNPPPLQKIAESVGLSRSQLTKTFKKVFGDTVFGILRKERLECAKKMLEEGSYNLTEIAYECGFSNPSHFTKTFTSKFGSCPKQYQTSVFHQQLGTPI